MVSLTPLSCHCSPSSFSWAVQRQTLSERLAGTLVSAVRTVVSCERTALLGSAARLPRVWAGHAPQFTERLQAYAEENGLFFWETSAKANSNVAEVFADIAARLPRAAAPASPPLGGITLTDAAPERAKKSACC